MLPNFIRKLFDQEGFGDKLRKDIIPYLDASILKTGQINPNLLPDLAYNILYRVDTETERLLLTTDKVQNYDFVLVNNDLLYIVVDDTKLNTEDGYLVLLSLTNFAQGTPKVSETAEKLKNPIDIVITGVVSGTQQNWDGSSDININITEIDKSNILPLNIVEYMNDDKTEIVYNDLGKIFPLLRESIIIQKIDLNGWYCYIKNIGSTMLTVTSTENATIDSQSEYKIAPNCVIKFISDGFNFITIDNTPRIVLE